MAWIGNVLKPLAKSVWISSGVTAAASETDEVIHKKMFGSDNTRLITSNEEMNDIMKMNKSVEESSLLIKVLSEKIKNKAKEEKEDFLLCY